MPEPTPPMPNGPGHVDDPPALRPVYPDFLFKEFLAALTCLLVLAWLGLLVQAPLGAPADPEFTPNPAKAPWYFLGIQELLVYFDPWLAGVVIPVLMVVGLILIPLLDNDPAGAGSYAFRPRAWATVPFTIGLLLLLLLTVMAAGFRGPTGTGIGPGRIGAWPGRPDRTSGTCPTGGACL